MRKWLKTQLVSLFDLSLTLYGVKESLYISFKRTDVCPSWFFCVSCSKGVWTYKSCRKWCIKCVFIRKRLRGKRNEHNASTSARRRAAVSRMFSWIKTRWRKVKEPMSGVHQWPVCSHRVYLTCRLLLWCSAIPRLRMEAIHMMGVDDMSTQEIFRYFKEYPPAHIEWINDTSCK